MSLAVARQPSELGLPPIPAKANQSAAIGSSVSIKGIVISGEDLYFDGELEGSIEATGSTVTVGPNARITAGIKALRVVVSGSVLGPIVALDTLELRRTSKLVGDVLTSRIAIEDGAYFKGSIDIRR